MFPPFCTCPPSHSFTLQPGRCLLLADDPVGEVVAASLRPEQVANPTKHWVGGHFLRAQCRRFERRPAGVKPPVAAAPHPTHF
jgi:hypothetical protein